jgi:hypothetical protein
MTATDRLDFIEKKDEMKARVARIYTEHKEELMDYNNHLPKLLLKEKMESLKFLDKIFDWLANRI